MRTPTDVSMTGAGTPADDPIPALRALLERYLRGEVPVADVVAAYGALPDGATADFAFGLGGVDPEVADARMAALARALGPARGG